MIVAPASAVPVIGPTPSARSAGLVTTGAVGASASTTSVADVWSAVMPLRCWTAVTETGPSGSASVTGRVQLPSPSTGTFRIAWSPTVTSTFPPGTPPPVMTGVGPTEPLGASIVAAVSGTQVRQVVVVTSAALT